MTRAPETHPLDEQARTRLAALADALIPGGQGLPSASDAQIAGEWIDRVLAAAPALAEAVAAVVDVDVDEPADPGLPGLHERDPTLFDRFAFAVSGAYLMNPIVRRKLGYPGVAPRRLPAAEGEADYYLEDDVLEPVVARGSLVRPVAEETSDQLT